MRLALPILLSLALGAAPAAHACTTLQLTAKDGAVVYGRTLEFGFDVKSEVLVLPAGTEMTGSMPDGGTGLRYKTKYGMAGANALGMNIMIDGISEKGLSLSALYFPGYASYAKATPETKDRAMAPQEFGAWVLGSFATLDEIKAGLDQVVLVATDVEALGGPAPLHFLVRDAEGRSIVIEPIDGTLVVSDNPVGVMTNSPTFDWHLTNLRNYTSLTARNLPTLVLGGGFALPQFGQGTGMAGLPGDSSSPSRFVRAVAFSQTALTPKTADEGVLQILHIMNNFDIPIGSVREVQGKEMHTDYTVWTSAADLKNLRWYFRTYEDQSIRVVDLKEALEGAKGQVGTIKMDGTPQPIENVSQQD
ncbi:choloylglycine hydrolase [Rhodoligotrophos appendicifer]|uniref:linear amide C-N hydrolase n=1 Tax=Rhodoligotrophos appendicifer TaxID=987056 RepID=UPI0011854E00|nr:choloylglycine hydrolase family protein [Rhodoligotrophos appendicifer]